MPTIRYTKHRFSPQATHMIRLASEIIEEYAAQGFDLTLRQLYYQFVARGHLPNTQQSYKRLGSVVNDARLAGLIDWERVVDRTRHLRSQSHWTSPANIVDACAHSYRMDLWENQPCRVEVWIEKDALVGILDTVCPPLDIPYFSCRGYTSQSELWGAARRLLGYMKNGQRPVILHLGDHDPSGVDMTRDITDRLMLFLVQDWLNEVMDLGPGQSRMSNEILDDMEEHCGARGVTVDRLALNMDQVEEYDPPPNPAKMTDSRATGYVETHGDQSWELDALDPNVLAGLITGAVDALRNQALWDAAVQRQEEGRTLLQRASNRWAEVREFLEG